MAKNKGNRAVPAAHPYLIALHGVAFMYAANYNETYLNDALTAAAYVLAAVAILHLSLWAAFKDAAKSALLLSMGLIALTLPGGQLLRSVFSGGPAAGGFLSSHATAFLLLSFAAALWLIIYITRSASTFSTATTILNVMAAAALAMPCYSIARSVAAYGKLNYYNFPSRAAFREPRVELRAGKSAPDIYYIIFDRYAAQSTQREHFGRGNPRLYPELERRGFFVADKSLANHEGTPSSLSSSLNFRYHKTADMHADFYAQIEANDAARFLARRGYKYYNLGSFFEGTARSRVADVSFNTWLYSRMSPFAVELFRATALHYIYGKFVADGYTLLRRNNAARVAMLTEELPKSGERKFVFAHFLLPHEPFIYNRDGSPRPRFAANPERQSALYIAQLEYTDSLILKIADSIQKNSTRPAVVVFQSDEGATSVGEDISGRALSRDELMAARARILNALYLPGISENDKNRFLRRDMSPVNTFRTIFDVYFDAGLAILPDRYFIRSTSRDIKSAFVDVTSKVAY